MEETQITGEGRVNFFIKKIISASLVLISFLISRFVKYLIKLKHV